MSLHLTDSASSLALEDQSPADAVGVKDRLNEEVVALFERYREPLLRYLSGFGLTISDGEEVTQEVFLALFLQLQRGESRENPAAWLFRVAHNLGLKRRYRNQRSVEVQPASAGDMSVDSSPNPELQVQDRQMRQRLLAVVRALPEQDRRCLVLRAEGLRYRGIAQVLDMSLSAVALSLTRSLTRIARAAGR
jgi:RNA polymerase sigma-70 factor, ECF subfamily